MAEHLKPMANKDKPSKVEEAKRKSHYLRGTITEILTDQQAESFEHDDMQIMKFHGIYQQDDRDARSLARVTGQGKQYSFMLRIRIPGGVLTPEQYLALDRLSDEVTYNASLRVTTRQAFQLHGVVKGTLKATMQRINELLLSTLCGCGDVERNIMSSPAPLADTGHQALRRLANDLAGNLCPESKAYYEVWLDGKKVETSQTDEEGEPLYGETYLPRKFKTGIALPDDNAVDVHSQDVGLVAILEDGRLKGANVMVGGGLGMTHKKPETYARLGTRLGYVDAEHIVETVRTIATIFRDYGDRTDRKHARLKYIVEEQGIDNFRAEFRERVDFELKDWVEVGELKHRDWLGQHPQGDGKFFYGLFIPNGRIIDHEVIRYKAAVRTIVEALRPEVILTPNQNVIFGNLAEEDVEKVEKVLEAFNVPKVEDVTAVKRHAMACVALPTCGLALTEAERVFPGVMEKLEEEFRRVGLEDEPVTVRMTGCPNGCARPYTADIGLVGHKPGHYDVFLGGSIHGHRMAEFYAENVPIDELAPTLRPIIEAWGAQRMPAESLGEFYNRVYCDGEARHLATGSRDNPARDRIAALIQA